MCSTCIGSTSALFHWKICRRINPLFGPFTTVGLSVAFVIISLIATIIKNNVVVALFLHSDKKNDLSHQVWKKKNEIYNDLNLHIVTPSCWLGDCAKQSSLLEHFPVTVIPNCLSVDAFRPLDEAEISPRWRNFQEKNQKRHFHDQQL